MNIIYILQVPIECYCLTNGHSQGRIGMYRLSAHQDWFFLSGPFTNSVVQITSIIIASFKLANRILNMNLFTLTRLVQTLGGPPRFSQ